jgi:hypothetical protein
MPKRVLLLLLPLAGAAGCERPGPTPARFDTLCDSEQLRADIGRRTELDTRPRPECRPSVLPPAR